MFYSRIWVLAGQEASKKIRKEQNSIQEATLPLRFWEQVLEKSQKGRALKRDVDGSTDSSWVSRRGEEWIG